MLDDSIIPEWRDEIKTLQEAKLDPDFGEFLPVNVPTQFVFSQTRRMLNQNFDGMLAFWHSDMHTIMWQVSRVEEHHIERIVSINDRESFDLRPHPIPLPLDMPWDQVQTLMNPVFLAEEITLEAIQVRAAPIRSRVGSQNDSFQFHFSVLFKDAVISIDIGGMTPEQIWRMLPR